MSKKSSTSMTSSTIMAAVVALIFLSVVILYFLGPDALLAKTAEGGDWIADRVLGGIKKDYTEKTKLESDKSLEMTYENILSLLRSEGSGPCIIMHGQFADDFDDFKISLSKVEQGIFVQLINSKGQYVESKTISGKSPCVVDGDAAKNFYDNYLDGSICKSNCPKDYREAQIVFRDGGSIYANGDERKIEGNIVFRAKDGNVCFLPAYSGFLTSMGCESGEKGLDNNCIKKIKEVLPSCRKLDEWPKILEDYEKNKCKVDKYTCGVENLGCQCFPIGSYENMEKPEVCDAQQPYCYNMGYGCDNKGPDYGDRLELCKETNPDFELAPECIVDKDTCKVTNAPCSCHTAGSKAAGGLPGVCIKDQYCYNEQIGCDDEGPAQDKPIYAEYCQNAKKLILDGQQD